VRDAAISCVGIAVLAALLTMADDRVRDQGTRLAAGGVVAAGAQADMARSLVLDAAGDLNAEQLTLAGFVVVAAGLVVAMLRM
jgi:hypothetical protein